MQNSEWSSYQSGLEGTIAGPAVTTSHAQNFRNLGAYEQGVRDAKSTGTQSSISDGGGSHVGGGGVAFLMILEGFAFASWIFPNEYPIIKDTAVRSTDKGTFALAILIILCGITFIINLMVYQYITMWLTLKLRWWAVSFFCSLWVYVGYNLAEYFRLTGSWQIGIAVAAGLFAALDRYASLSKG